MKEFCIKAVKWLTGVSALMIIIGSFLPYVSSKYSSDAISFIEIIGETEETTYAAIMVVAILASLFLMFFYDEAVGMLISFLMLISSGVGYYCFELYQKQYNRYIGYFLTEKGIGGNLMEIGYVVLILAAVFAIGVDVCRFYFSKLFKESFQRMVGPMGQEMYTCPKCGKQYKEKSEYCGACGFAMGSLKCPDCGADRDSNANFCKKCGKRLPVIAVNSAKSSAPSMITGGTVGGHWICAGCGEENPVSLLFCHKCGKGK